MGAKVIARLKTLYTLTHFRSRLHITLRDLRSALAYMLVGTRDCDGVHQLYNSNDDRNRQAILDGFYFNAWMGGNKGNSDRFLSLLREIDVGEVNNANLDRQIAFLEPDSGQMGQFSFDRWHIYANDLLTKEFRDLNQDLGDRFDLKRFDKHRNYVATLRRRYYFECRSEAWQQMLPYHQETKDNFLKIIKNKIENPTAEISNLVTAINRDRPEEVIEHQVNFNPSSELDKFIAARTDYFQAISQDSKQLISQAANFWGIKQIGFAYVRAYQDLLQQLQNKIEQSDGTDTQAFEDLKNILAIDTIKLTIINFRGQTKEALLLSPTHPLRALWWITWAATGQEWLETTQTNSKESIGDVREGILKELFPLNFPLALPLSDRRFFVAVDNIHPFWSLYAPTSEIDPRGLIGEICNALGVRELSSTGSSITGELIANRIERYLVQHPYISTLTINLFNPGQATLLAKAITLLQEYQLPHQPSNLTAILEYLRSLSGKLALKLLSTPQHQAEVLGLALARQFLQYQGALSNQIIHFQTI